MMELDKYLKHLESLHPKKIDLTLARVTRLLDRLGNPEQRLPPVIHVAGTNGKGSTIAMLRVMFEAAGLHAHVYTSPHLIKFNERIRLAGTLVDDAALLAALQKCERANDCAPITFFEITTVAAFLLFAGVPADVLLLEVGLGGRLDATNVVTPVISAITRISRDHTEFLGDTLREIAGEKAGIMKPGVPCVISYQKDEVVYDTFAAHAEAVGTPLYQYKNGWTVRETANNILYRFNTITHNYPLPSLVGAHQVLNAGVAITCAKLFSSLQLPASHLIDKHIAHGLTHTQWPGRLQQITSGTLFEMLPDGTELWIDGAHNDSGAEVLAEQCRRWQAQDGKPLRLIMGMQAHKDVKAFLETLAPYMESVTLVPVPGHASISYENVQNLLDYEKLSAAADLRDALSKIMVKPAPVRQRVVVAGSLYLSAPG